MSTETITPITGTIVDKETNDPIRWAMVKVFTYLDEFDGQTPPHKDGAFSITPYYSSPIYTVTIESGGYRTIRRQIDTTVGDSFNMGTLKMEKLPS